MASMILKGSKGFYTPAVPKPLGNNNFEVVHDTCSDSETLPVKFNGASEVCRILMKRATFTELKTSDFQGP